MTKLYELAERYRLIAEMLDSPPEQVSREEIEKSLSLIQDEIEEKATGIAKVILEAEQDIASLKAEEERLSKRRSALQNKVEWLKGYLLADMQSVNVLKIKRDVVTVSVRNSPPSVEIADAEQLPTEFIRIIPETKAPDKRAIITHFRETGEVPPGANIITTNKFLEIR
ncbi:MAG TPA: siphovirus Gp157 family protein [Elusimicrobiales bacterium]|nr:siphovirus Gp157 family protein [Elusimicrobiales bacterium]